MDFYPSKAQFCSGEEVFLCTEEILSLVDRIEIKVKHLEECVKTISFVPSKENEIISLGIFCDESVGYGVDIDVFGNGVIEHYHTAPIPNHFR